MITEKKGSVLIPLAFVSNFGESQRECTTLFSTGGVLYTGLEPASVALWPSELP
jgi:hypothetical protein